MFPNSPRKDTSLHPSTGVPAGLWLGAWLTMSDCWGEVVFFDERDQTRELPSFVLNHYPQTATLKIRTSYWISFQFFFPIDTHFENQGSMWEVSLHIGQGGRNQRRGAKETRLCLGWATIFLQAIFSATKQPSCHLLGRIVKWISDDLRRWFQNH